MTPERKSGRAPLLEILRAPSVAAYISANILLYVGLSLQVTTLAKQVYDITKRELDLGWLGLAEFLPIALLVFVTGTVADRYNRKRISQFAMLGELASALLLAWYASTEPTGVFPIFVIAILYGSSRAFLAPSMRPIAAAIAPEGRLPQMIALYSTVWTSAGIIGPAASGFLYSASPVLAYLVGSALIGCAITSFSTVRVPPTKRAADDASGELRGVGSNERPTLRSAIEGLSYIRRTPILFAAIALDLFAFIGATNELGAFESGVAAAAVGVPATVVGGGVFTLGIVGVWWVKFKQLRNVDRFEDLKSS
ncbi:MAG: MFS transporter [Acidimicrobiia bacterium]|nr:MFS transporter [Acidimicrobiia bacterium]